MKTVDANHPRESRTSDSLPSSWAASVDCDKCDQQHRVDLSVTYRARGDLGLVFAGPESDKGAVVQWAIKFECPTTHAMAGATVQVPIDRKHQVDHVVAHVEGEPDDQPLATSRAAPAEPPEEASPPAWVGQELERLRGASLETGRGFGSTMIVASTTAIGVYFAVLKYLGFENIGGPLKGVTVVPPILLLVSAAVFAAAIRPVLSAPESLGEFESYWRKRLRTMNLLIVIAMVLFLIGMGVSIPIFLGELR
jgi:hypothetical protein